MLINLIKTRNACLSFSLAVSQVWVKITKLFQTNKDYVKRFKITIRVKTGCLSPRKKMLEKEGRKKASQVPYASSHARFSTFLLPFGK